MVYTKNIEGNCVSYMTAYNQAAGVLPFELRQVALSVPHPERCLAEEIRLRIGQPITITLPEGEVFLPSSPIVTARDLSLALENATQSSIHTVLDKMKRGFLTLQGGHRMGLCGTIAMDGGIIHNLCNISSVNIRIARQIRGIGEEIICRLRGNGGMPSVLILAPPGMGKTTLLRDIICGLSNGVGGVALRVGVVDERGELAAVHHGATQMDLGAHTDVMDGCSKADGMLMLLRGMSPQVLAVDEVTDPLDVDAMETAVGCGTIILATAHGKSLEDMERRPLYARLRERKIFSKVILIDRECGMRRYRLEDMP